MAAAASIFALALIVPSGGVASASSGDPDTAPLSIAMSDVPPVGSEPTPSEPPPEPSPTAHPTPLAPDPSPDPPPESSPEPPPSEPPLPSDPIATPPPDIAGAETPIVDVPAAPPAGEPGAPAAPVLPPAPAVEPPAPAVEPPAPAVEPPPPPATPNGTSCCGQPPVELPPAPAIDADAPSPEPTQPVSETPPLHESVAELDHFATMTSSPAVSDRREHPTAAAGPAERESSAPAGAPAPRATPWGDPGRAPRPGPADATVVEDAVVASAGIAAGLAVVNRAPPAVAAAIEFGRLGGGWAGAIVFNLWLRRQMSARRMSQRQLAALSGVDHSTISRLLREDRQPSLTTATKLVHALRGVPSDAAEPATADFFDRMPEEIVFPARRVELALRADEELDDDQVRRLMTLYLNARRRTAEARAGPGPAELRREPVSRR